MGSSGVIRRRRRGCTALEPPDVQRGGSARFERQQPVREFRRVQMTERGQCRWVGSPGAVQADEAPRQVATGVRSSPDSSPRPGRTALSLRANCGPMQCSKARHRHDLSREPTRQARCTQNRSRPFGEPRRRRLIRRSQALVRCHHCDPALRHIRGTAFFARPHPHWHDCSPPSRRRPR
jgi:hypothetical protein